MRPLHGVLALLILPGLQASQAFAQNTSQLSENGWFSDDTRADGLGANPAGTNLVSTMLTDDPEATASGTAAHDADIRRQITFGPAPGVVPAGTHAGAVHLRIGPSASGKSQISHRKDDGVGHASGADAFGPATSITYSWMGDGTPTVTAGFKLGVKTPEFGMAGVSPRTGENAWDKVLIYEPGNLNGGLADGTWQTETVDFTTGKWWFFDRVAGAGSIGMPMTLSDMSTSAAVYSGTKTLADVYALITAPGAHVTSVQFGIGSGNAGGSVHVNELETSFYRAGSTTTFGFEQLACDQDVTNAAIFGSGNDNGSFTVHRTDGLEIGLRGKLRFDATNSPANVFNSNGDGTYTFEAGHPTGGGLPSWAGATTPFWSFEWSVNTDYDGSTADLVGDYTYELGMDFDPGWGTEYLVFDPIAANSVIPYDVPETKVYWDHSMGDNSTGSGAGVEAGDLTTYQTYLNTYNLAQNSWTYEFYNEAPFAGFDPDVPGRYEVYLAAFDGATEVARSHITILVEVPEELDQDVTNAAIFGSGNDNGSFTTGRLGGVELGLRGKLRFDSSNSPANVFNSNGDGTYTFSTGAPTGGASWAAATTPFWNVEWSANVDFDASSGWMIGDLAYEMGMDFDPSADTDYLVFDPIAPSSVLPFTAPFVMPWWDHSMGTNATGSGAGVEATDVPTYLALIASSNLAQNSWSPEFYNEPPFDGFDPNVPGRYDFYLAAFDGGAEVSRSDITIVVVDEDSLVLEADACQTDADCNLPGVQVEVELWMRNLSSDVTGFQGFLAFDASQLTYEGGASSYSSAPFPSHIQGVSTAEVAAGELRLDGSVTPGSMATAGEDALLATLVFTVAAECDPVSVAFDLTQSFASELSFQGSAVPTALVDSGSIVPDATPPLLDPVADIVVPADACVGGGCASAVVNYSPPSATDTCSAVSVACYPPPGTAFPAGETTTVTCVATDACGNTTVDTFDVTVTPTNSVFVQIQLVGVSTATSRCITFVADDCGAVADVVLPFDATGFFAGSVELPCGTWTQVCAKDRQHTLWGSSTLSLSMDGTSYVADSVIELEGGDTDDDGDVDINDVTLFLFQFGQLYSDGGCPWDGTRDADFNDNGAVGSSDYGFLTANWLALTGCGCTGMLPGGDGDDDPSRMRRRVTSGWEANLDLHRDGWIDHRDVRLFEERHGLPDRLSERMRGAAPRRR